ncbi:hypothetical protein BGX28_006572 [Mortierella sp. GBA30]|nr:hypothetical protein BGX28_006572 [Mortierella sp. GBA30]
MNLDDFTIRNTRPDELDEFIEILETAAEWLKANGIKQWPIGMFRESRASIATAIDAKQCFTIDHHALSLKLSNAEKTIAGIFVLNYDDPFDELLWKGYVLDWKDALYLHRLVIKKSFQGAGLMSNIIAFAEEKVIEARRHFLRMDCIADNTALRRYYAERCRGKDRGGFKELTIVWNPDLQLEFARFEIQVVPV